MSDDDHPSSDDEAFDLDRREFLGDALIVSAAAASWWGITAKSDALAQTPPPVPETVLESHDTSSHYTYSD